MLQEKSALGFYFSGHPYHGYAGELSGFVRQRLADLEPAREPQLLAGIIVSIRTQMSRRGKMAIVLLDDGSSTLDVVVFAELLEAHRDWLKRRRIVDCGRQGESG